MSQTSTNDLTPSGRDALSTSMLRHEGDVTAVWSESPASRCRNLISVKISHVSAAVGFSNNRQDRTTCPPYQPYEVGYNRFTSATLTNPTSYSLQKKWISLIANTLDPLEVWRYKTLMDDRVVKSNPIQYESQLRLHLQHSYPLYYCNTTTCFY